MEYAWEKKARKEIGRSEMLNTKFGPRGKFRVIGIAVANDETGEAALLMRPPSGCVIGADFAKDIAVDASEFYLESVEAAFGQFV